MKNRKLIFMVFTLLCVVAAGVCLIVNLAVNRQITWAAYPLISIAFGWALLLPLLAGKHRLVLCLCALTVLVLPYLYCLSRITPSADWFVPVGVPSAAIGAVMVWLLLLLSRFKRINIWYKAAVAIFLLGVIVSPAVNYFVDIYVGQRPFGLDRIINIFACVVAAGALGILGYKNSKSKSESKPDADGDE